VDVLPLGRQNERLLLEKTAVGFFFSGHLFDEVALRCASLQAPKDR
jgi:hypothetical protein